MAFSGTVTSDFLKLVAVEDTNKDNLINFAATDFLSLRQSLIDYIKAVYPLDYNYYAESDLGMMLIEVIAYMGHVLSYKADYLANENYLSTARSRDSVKKLLQLIGIRMKGPIAAAANASITLATAPAWTPTGTSYLEISPANRVVSINSPLDGAPLTYTLYKVASDGDVDNANVNGSLIVYESEKDTTTTISNLVLLEGALVIETGTFADTEAVKSVTLQQSPVIEGSVQAFITGGSNTSGVYNQVENVFYASGSGDKVFQLISTDNYGATVVFGDNNLGQSPNIGDSYTILYRIGGGVRGNIINSLINAQITTTFNGNSTTTHTATVQNTSQGTGGADAETIEHAKKYAPLVFRSQDRLVTLQDFKAFANTFISSYGSVGKATAITRRAYSSANIIDVYVLEKSSDIQLRKSTPEFKRQLITAINDLKMLTDEIVIVDGLIRTLDLNVTIRVDSKYESREESIKNKVRSQILKYFSVDNNDFGKEFNPQDLTRTIFDIPEVRFATIDNVPNAIKMNFNEIVQINNFTLNVVYV